MKENKKINLLDYIALFFKTLTGFGKRINRSQEIFRVMKTILWYNIMLYTNYKYFLKNKNFIAQKINLNICNFLKKDLESQRILGQYAKCAKRIFIHYKCTKQLTKWGWGGGTVLNNCEYE